MANVLVVDDEPDILDCVLLDVMMPVMDGWSVLEGVAQLVEQVADLDAEGRATYRAERLSSVGG